MMKMMAMIGINIQATIKTIRVIETLLKATLTMSKRKVLLSKIDLPNGH